MTTTERLEMIKKASIKDMNECNRMLKTLKPLENSQQWSFWQGRLHETRRIYNMTKEVK
jgi:hypothetical protein